MRKALSRSYWLLGLAGNVHWAIYTGAGLVVAALSTAYAFVREMPPLLLVPLFLGAFLIIVGLVNHAANWRAARQKRLTSEERSRTENELQQYSEQLQEWVLDKDTPLEISPPEDPRRNVARMRTLELLEKLDANGKKRVLKYLHRWRLISERNPVILLKDADFSGANLANERFLMSYLDKVCLHGADLRHAVLSELAWTEPVIEKATQRRLDEFAFGEPIAVSSLYGADLTDADLRGLCWQAAI